MERNVAPLAHCSHFKSYDKLTPEYNTKCISKINMYRCDIRAGRNSSWGSSAITIHRKPVGRGI